MDEQTFTDQLARDGFSRPQPGRYEGGRYNPPHTHPFEVRGLVTRGEMTIAPVDGSPVCYGAGQVFTMHRQATHTETVGAEGCDYLWGRREAD